MSNPAFDLFLLATSLSQMKNREIVIASFIGGVNALFPQLGIGWADRAAPERRNRVEVCTRNETFGFLVYAGDVPPDETTGTLIHNAGQMLGVILERIHQDQLLRERNEALATLARERTRAAEELEVRVAQRTAELEKANQALRESRETLHLVLDTVPQAVFWKDTESRYLGCNRVFAEAVGLGDPARIVGKTDFDLPWRREEADAYRADDREVLETNQPKRHIVEPLQRADGVRLVVDTSKAPLRDADGRPFGILGVYEDITERKQAETALRENRRRLELALHGGRLGIWDWQPETGAVAYSDLWAEMLGYRPEEVEPTVGFFERHVHPDDLSSVLDRLTGHLEGRLPVYQSEHRLRTKSGRWIWVFDRGEVTERGKQGRAVRVTGVISNITERKRVEEELIRYRDHLEELAEQRARELEVAREQARRADRLASIGTFAAGIAHEINNPLGMMLLATDVALASLDQPARLTELLQETRQSIERCARIVRGVLGFSKTQSTERRPLNLSEVVLNGIDFTKEYCATQGVTVDVRLADRLAPVLGHAVELGQVVVNLIRNAVQACKPGGHVTIETREEDQQIRLTVKDDGCGMTPEQTQRAFDPFYTTKLEKGGTGLGLSIVHGIVASHQGTIEVASEDGRGTVFTVTFGRCAETGSNDAQDPNH